MNNFIFIATALSFVFAVSAFTIDTMHNDFYHLTDSCIPNKGFINQCNFCSCDDDGVQAVCSIMICQTPEHPRIDGYYNDLGCPPGEAFLSDCNSCVCDKSGKAAECTFMAGCTNGIRTRKIEDPLIPQEVLYKQGDECPAKKFYVRCNLCECNEDGHSAVCANEPCLPVMMPGIH